MDLGSTNGTFVNGERLDGRQRLRDGDVVQIGDTELRFEQ
jgi:pSer/pThr/pTyr-binding forkhead associated (FHA) protein